MDVSERAGGADRSAEEGLIVRSAPDRGRKKIFVVGMVAAGKTTLARRLSAITGVPWHELDRIVHHRTAAGRIRRTEEEQLDVIQAIDGGGAWIFEGTDRKPHQILYEMADIVIFLDPPLWKRRIRILLRFLKQKLGAEACDYEPDFAMLRMMYRWTCDFERNRRAFEAKLRKYGGKTIRLQTNKQLRHSELKALIMEGTAQAAECQRRRKSSN